MDNEFYNFISYNSTGLDPAKILWINDLTTTFKCDFFQNQEHFKAIKTVDNFFKSNFRDFKCFVTPAIRNQSDHAGRPKGGLAQFVNKNIAVKLEHIVSNHWRLQAKIVHFENYRLLWLNAYFPTDPQTQIFDEYEVTELLNAIDNIISNTSFHDILFGGDINHDESRNTRFSRIVSEFMDKHELRTVWSKFGADFTYQHTNLTSFSTIDHFYVTENFLNNCCVDAAPIHLGDNRSNHSPIMLKIKVPAVGVQEIDDNVIKQKPDWKKSSEHDKAQFSRTLEEKLANIVIPDSIVCNDVTCNDVDHSDERDSYLIDVMTAVIETSFECVPVTTNRPVKSKTKLLPGWRENVLPAKNDSLFWHSVWVSAGKPVHGGLFNVMKWTRNKYTYAVRKAKQLAKKLESQTLGEAAASGNLALFKEMKKYLFKTQSGQTFPDKLEGKVSQPDIIEKFKECYEALYNSADTRDEMLSITQGIDRYIRNNIDSSVLEVNKITGKVVADAAAMMKAGKSDVSGSYTSDVFKHAPLSLFDHLSSVFRSFVMHGTISKQILCCAFLPLFKGGTKDPSKFDSYRAIAGASQLLKLFEYTVLILWGDKLTSDSLQFGFKKSVSTTHCSWLVTEVANYYVQRGGRVHACFLDCSKAFDKVLFNKLFLKMLAKGVPPVVVRVLIYAYQEQKGWVRLGKHKSEEFDITNGTRQGSVLSPFLFAACYLDDLLVQLRQSELGCYVAGVWVGCTAYADDLALLAPNREVLQKMVTICENYGKEHNLVFSTDPNPAKSKTKCILFCGSNTRVKYPNPVVLDNKNLPWVQKVDHLGHVLQQNLSNKADCIRARASFMNRASDLRDNLYFASSELKMKAINLNCCDAYGAMIWNLNGEYVDKFFRAWNIQSRLAFNVPRNTHTNLVEEYFCAGIPSLRKQTLSRYPKFVSKLLENPSREIKILSNFLLQDQRSILGRNYSYLNELINKENCLYLSGAEVRSLLPRLEVESWRTSLLTTMLNIRLDNSYNEFNINKAQVDEMVNSLCSS